MASIYWTTGESIFVGDNGMASWLHVTPEEEADIYRGILAWEMVFNESNDATPAEEWNMEALGAVEATAEELREEPTRLKDQQFRD